jgi:hypothetical protein
VFRPSADHDALIVEAGAAAAAVHAELARLGLPVAEIIDGQIKLVGDRDQCDVIIEIVLAVRHFRLLDPKKGDWYVPDYRSWPDLARTLREATARLKLAQKGTPGPPGYPEEVADYAIQQRQANPCLAAKFIRSKCLTHFADKYDHLDMPSVRNFPRWLRRLNQNRS